MMLKTSAFHLAYDDSWEQHADENPDTCKLVSDKYRTVVTISFKHWDCPPDTVEGAANEYLDLRFNAENELISNAGRTAEIEKNVKELPFGFQIEYNGSDSEGRNFRYWGIVASTKVVNIHMETYEQSADGLDQLFRQLLQGLKL